MKLKILLILLCFFKLGASGQTGIKIYGYYQDVLPGTIPKGNGEDGKVISGRKNAVDYMIYFTGPANTPITIIEMYVKGINLQASTEKVNKSPVFIKDNLGRNVMLVPRTSMKIQKINPSGMGTSKRFSKAKEKAGYNELVVVYKMNGKYYSVALKKLTRLEPKSNE